jgi:hypothetical protein
VRRGVSGEGRGRHVGIESCARSVVDPELKGIGTERISPCSRCPLPLHQTEPRSPQPTASCPPPQEWPAERFLDQTRGFVQKLNSATQDPSIRRLYKDHTDFLRAKCSGFPSCGARRRSGMHPPLSAFRPLPHTRHPRCGSSEIWTHASRQLFQSCTHLLDPSS